MMFPQREILDAIAQLLACVLAGMGGGYLAWLVSWYVGRVIKKRREE